MSFDETISKAIEAEKRLMFKNIKNLFEAHGITDEVVIKEKFEEIYLKTHEAAMAMMTYGVGAVKVTDGGKIEVVANKELFKIEDGTYGKESN